MLSERWDRIFIAKRGEDDRIVDVAWRSPKSVADWHERGYRIEAATNDRYREALQGHSPLGMTGPLGDPLDAAIVTDMLHEAARVQPAEVVAS